MLIIQLIRIIIIVLFGIAFFLLSHRLTISRLRGYFLMGSGLGLILLNMFVGALFHSKILPEELVQHWFPLIGFVTGTLGQPVGIILFFVGVYQLMKFLQPHLNEYYSSLVERSLVGVYLIQGEALKFINPRCAEIFGYKREELIDKRVTDLVAPKSRPIVKENIRKRIMGEVDSLHYRFKGLKKDGNKIDVEVFGNRTIYDGKPAIHGTLIDITDRCRIEQLLRESEERYRKLVEKAPVAIVVHSEGIIKYANPAAIKLVKAKTSRELLGESIFRFVHPDFREVVEEKTKLSREKIENSPPMEEKLVQLDGKKIDIEVTGIPIYYQQKPSTMLVIRDITDRKRVEATLKESERRLKKLNKVLVELARSRGEIVEDREKIFTNFTKASAQALEVERVSLWFFNDDHSAIECVDIFQRSEGQHRRGNKLAVSDYPVYFKALEENRVIAAHKAWEDPRTREFTRNYLKPLGIKSMMDAAIRKEGQLIGVICHEHIGDFREWTPEEQNFAASLADLISIAVQALERKRAEEALKKSEEQYRALFEESQDVIYISTPEGKIIDINPAGVKLFGYPSKESLLKVDIARDLYWNPADREKIAHILEKEGYIKDFELELKRKDGRKVTVLETTSAVKDESGQVVAYRGILRDITEHKQLEQQLFQAQKMESIGTLAGGIAHDFNNILGGILGYASFIKMKMKEDDPFYNYVNAIEKGVERAAELTAQLLAFARGGKYNIKPLNLNKVIQDTLTIVERTFDKSIEIQTLLDSDLPAIEADPAQIQQVVMNLCVNARDAMPVGGKLIIRTGVTRISGNELNLHFRTKPGKYVVLTVTDTGVGMDKETQARVFEPFFTTKEKGKGSGLGLSMVYGVIKNHDGFIRVKSELNRGSTFEVYLPASRKSEEKEARITFTPSKGHEVILVVEDEEAIRKMLKDVLESHGYQVLLAENGLEAVEIYREQKNKIGLVILDMIMPKLNGRETFLKLKEINPEVKTLLSTGYSHHEKAQEILNNGASGFINKPYQVTELLSEIRRILDVAMVQSE